MKFPRRMLLAVCILVLSAVVSTAPAAFAQDACPLPADVTENPLATPSITAAQVEAGTADLNNFALAARDYMQSVQIGAELTYNACLIRHDGPWKSGSTYLVTVSLDGRVFFHSARASLSGRPLSTAVYVAILRALGITATSPADIRAALASVVQTGQFPERGWRRCSGSRRLRRRLQAHRW